MGLSPHISRLLCFGILVSFAIPCPAKAQSRDSTLCARILQNIVAFAVPVIGIPVATYAAVTGNKKNAGRLIKASTLGVAAAVGMHQFLPQVFHLNNYTNAHQLWHNTEIQNPVLIIEGPEAPIPDNLKKKEGWSHIQIEKPGDLEKALSEQNLLNEKFRTIILIGHHQVLDDGILRLKDEKGGFSEMLSSSEFSKLTPHLGSQVSVVCHSCQALASPKEDKIWTEFAESFLASHPEGQLSIKGPTKILKNRDTDPLRSVQEGPTAAATLSLTLNPAFLPMIMGGLNLQHRFFFEQASSEAQKVENAWNDQGDHVRTLEFPQ